MKVKVTYPIPDHDHIYQAGTVVDVDPEKAKRWIEKDWCFEIEDEEPKEVKHGKKPKQE